MYKFLVSAILLIFVFATQIEFAGAGTLACDVRTAASCSALPGVQIYRMSGSINAHAELGTRTTAVYDNNVVCCWGVSGLGNSCSGSFATTTALNLSAPGNSHASQIVGATYTTPACISVPSTTTVAVAYQSGSCTGYDTTMGSMQAVTNAHVGTSTAYTYKVCASSPAGAANVAATASSTSSVLDTGFASGVGYNSVMWKGTLPTGTKVQFQLATANSTTGPWVYYGSTAGVCSTANWFDPSAPNAPTELNCPTQFNDKRYFRYKVRLCSSSDCVTPSPDTPTVTSVSVSYAP